MHYRGDGSYERSSGVKPETSLLDLINTEDRLVTRFNEAQASYAKAQQSGYNCGDCSRIVENYRQQLEDARSKIRDYLVNKLMLKVDEVRLSDSGVVNLSRMGNRLNRGTPNMQNVQNMQRPQGPQGNIRQSSSAEVGVGVEQMPSQTVNLSRLRRRKPRQAMGNINTCNENSMVQDNYRKSVNQ